MQDGADVGVDLTGGFYDAGDHVKFGLPMLSSMTLLAWGGIEYESGYDRSGQKAYLLDTIRWGADWIRKAHAAPNVFYGQVGNGGLDHSYWGPPETMTMSRPSYKITASQPGSEIAGEAAAAMAAAAILFGDEDPAYSAILLDQARRLFAFADQYRGTYTNAIPDAASFYNSYSGYNDELIWSAAWLYRATGETAYLQKAETLYNQSLANASLRWTHAWDDKAYGAIVLLAQLTGKTVYKTAAQRWLDYWTVGINGSRITTTPGGLAWLDQWGSLRYAANTALLAFIYGDTVADAGTRYRDFAKRQIDYMLGENPQRRSYVVGYGNNAPRNPHHRSSHGSWANSISNPVDNRNILFGALVGGPSSASDTAYADDRSNYVTNEVALDYNAGFTGAVARLAGQFGGSPLAGFPPAPTGADAEFFVEAAINQQGSGFTEIRALLNNRSTRPARASENLAFRYFVNLREVIEAGYNPSAIEVTTTMTQGGRVSQLIPFDPARFLYYVEVDFTGTRIAPGSGTSYRREVQFRMRVTNGLPGSIWNSLNDPSQSGLPTGGQAATFTPRIPVYESGSKLSGDLP